MAVDLVTDLDSDDWEPPPLPEPEWIGESPISKQVPEGRAVDSEHALVAFTDDLDKRRRGEIVGLPWPVEWPSLSRALGPLEPGSLTVIASRPSVGKTMFGMHLLRSLAARGHRVLYVTRELTVTRLVRRHVAAYGADMYRLRSGNLTQHDFDALANYQSDSREWQVFYDDHSRTIECINTEVILTQPDCIIVDYLQRLAYDTESEYAGITRIVNELQDLTLATDIPVVCLSQLSRPAKGFEAKAPSMSDTRGSGAVEERAANLVLLHRHWESATEERYGKQVEIAKTPTSEGWFIVAKSADGEAGAYIPVVFNGPRMSITERINA
jgi:replicative DNA helicase